MEAGASYFNSDAMACVLGKLTRMRPTTDSQEVRVCAQKDQKHEQGTEKATQMHVISSQW